MPVKRWFLLALCALPAAAQSALKLEDLERMALEKHPALAQASAGVRAAAGRTRQAGLYPNPVMGITGDEIAGGPIIRGGELGGFVEQRIVTAGKLSLDRRVAAEEQKSAGEMADAQKRRLLTAVRMLFYQALGDQRMLEVRSELAKLAGRAVEISRELANVGQADKPDLLAAEIEAQRADLALVSARNAQTRTWRQLAAAVNDLSLKPASLDADLEKTPPLDVEAAAEQIFAESPELHAAEIGSTRSELALRRAKVEKIPDLMIRGGVRYNRELLEQSVGGGLRPVGREGFFDIGVEVPIFNRYQGRIDAAKADAERSRLEVERTKLSLRTRLAAVYKEYTDARAASERYRSSMLPAARQAYDLYTASFRQMAAAYPQVLIAQRNLFQLQEDYVTALVTCWKSYVEIQGLLLE